MVKPRDLRGLYQKEEGYYHLLSGKLDDPHTSATIHTGLYKLKTLYNGKKI